VEDFEIHHLSKRGAPSELWAQGSIDDEWDVAFRLVEQDGLLVVGEVRVFPHEERKRGWRPGEWGAGPFGDQSKVPEGGLAPAQLKKVRFGPMTERLAQHMRATNKKWGVAAFAGPDSLWGRSGVNQGAIGGKRDDLWYARLAAAYCEYAALRSRGAVQRLVKDFGLDVKNFRFGERAVREALRRAEDRGLLEGRTSGRAGGRLTDKAHAVLERARKEDAK
jgi:hypothetical protein